MDKIEMPAEKLRVKVPIKAPTKFRHYQGPMAVLVTIICAGMCLFSLLYVSGTLAYAKIYLLENQYNAIFLAAIQTAIFLLVPASKKGRKDHLPWYDILLILFSLCGNLYVCINALELVSFSKLEANALEMVLGAVTILTLIEAVRRTLGWAMVIVSLAFLGFAKYGYLISGSLHLYPYSWSSLTADIYLGILGVYGTLLSVASNIIITFITFGVFFTRSGGSSFFMDVSLALAGSYRGGPAKVAVVGSALFGTLSGSPNADVAVTGAVTIPLMKDCGYQPHFAGAVEAVASTGGQIMPPVMGGVAFIMASILGIPYTSVAIMAIIPSVLFFTSLFIQIDLRAAKENLFGLSREQLPSLGTALRKGWEVPIPLLVLIILLFVMRYPAPIAAVYTILSVVVVSMFRKERRLNIKRIIECLEGGFKTAMQVAAIVALAGVIVGVLVGTGLGPKLSSGLVSLFGGSMILLIIASAITIYFMGMGVSLIASYILISVLVAPALEKLGLPLFVSHFFIMYMVTTTFITPPYCSAAFVASTIAQAHPFRIAFQAMRLGIVVYLVPFIIVYNPALIQIGTPGEIALATLTALISVFALAAGIEGYLFAELNWVSRILFIASGLAMIVPDTLSDIIGVAILTGLVLWHWKNHRAARATTTFEATSDSRKLL